MPIPMGDCSWASYLDTETNRSVFVEEKFRLVWTDKEVDPTTNTMGIMRNFSGDIIPSAMWLPFCSGHVQNYPTVKAAPLPQKHVHTDTEKRRMLFINENGRPVVNYIPDMKKIEELETILSDAGHLDWYYGPEKLIDPVTKKELFIRQTGVTRKKEGKTVAGEFYLGEKRHSQPTRLLRDMLKIAGKPKEIYEGKTIRAFQSLQTSYKGVIKKLEQLMPAYIHKTTMCQRPAKSPKLYR